MLPWCVYLGVIVLMMDGVDTVVLLAHCVQLVCNWPDSDKFGECQDPQDSEEVR